MYTVTKRNPRIFIIGICANLLYGFGKENKKLCIFKKSVFDAGNWEVFLKIEINVLESQCCDTGLHLCAGLNETKIWIILNEKNSTITTRLFSLDIFTKELTTFKVIDEFPASKLSCCNCSNSNIQTMRKINDNKLCISITKTRHELYFPRNVYFYNVLIDELQQICQFNFLGLTRIGSLISSNYIANGDRDILYVKEKYYSGRIKTFSINNYLGQKIVETQKGDSWNEIIFFYDEEEEMCCLRKSKLCHSNGNTKVKPYYIIDVCSVGFSYFEGKIKFNRILTFNVDSDFPSFGSSSIYVTSSFFVFQSSKRIITIPRRVLSLSEYAYISCLRISEPQKIKPSICRIFKKLFSKTPKKIKDPWMSLNFIKKTLKLSKNFELIPSFE